MTLTITPAPEKACGHHHRHAHVEHGEQRDDGMHYFVCPHCWKHHGFGGVAAAHVLADGIKKAVADAKLKGKHRIGGHGSSHAGSHWDTAPEREAKAHIDALRDYEKSLGHEYFQSPSAYQGYFEDIKNAKTKKEVMELTALLDDFLARGDKYALQDNATANAVRAFLRDFLLQERAKHADTYDLTPLDDAIALFQRRADGIPDFAGPLRSLQGLKETLSHPEAFGLFEQSNFPTVREEVAWTVAQVKKRLKRSMCDTDKTDAALNAILAIPKSKRPPIAKAVEDAPQPTNGERWITVHPNGEDEPGHPVLLKPHADGTYSIKGGAGGKLNGLRLANVKSPEEYRQQAREKKKQKALAAKQQAFAEHNARIEKHRAAVEQEYKAAGKEPDEKAIATEASSRAVAERDAAKIAQKAAVEKVSEEKQGHEKELIAAVAQAQGWNPQDYELSDDDLKAAKATLQEQHLAASQPLREALESGTPEQRERAQRILDNKVGHDVQAVAAAHHAQVLARAKEVLDNHRDAILSAHDDLMASSGDLSVGDLVRDTLGDSGKGYTADLEQQAGARGMDLAALREQAEAAGHAARLDNALPGKVARDEASAEARTAGAEKARARIAAAQERLGEAGAGLESIKTLDTTPKVAVGQSIDLLAQAKAKQAAIDATEKQLAAARSGGLDTIPNAAVVKLGAELTHEEALAAVEHDLNEVNRQRAMGDLLDLYDAQDEYAPLRTSLLAGHNGFFGNAAQVAATQGLGVRGPDPLMTDILGPSATAHVLHRALVKAAGSDSPTLSGVSQGLLQHHVDTQVANATQAVDDARELFNEADNLKDFPIDSMDSMLAGLDQNQRRMEIVRQGRDVVGVALGNLEAAAALNFAIMGGKPVDAVSVSLGTGSMEDCVTKLAALGLTQPDVYDSHGTLAKAGQYHLFSDGQNKVVEIHHEGLDALAGNLSEDPEHLKRLQTVAAIKAGENDEVGWLPDGISRRPACDVSRDPETDVPRLDLQLPVDSDTQPAALPNIIRDNIAQRIEAGQDPANIVADLRSVAFINTHVPEALQDDYRAALNELAPNFKAPASGKATAQDYIDHKTRVDEALRGYHAAWLQQQVADGKLDSVEASVHSQTLPATDTTRDLLHQVSIQDPRLQHAFGGVGELGRHGRDAVRSYAFEHVFRDDAGQPIDPKSDDPIDPLSPGERKAFDTWRQLRRDGNPYAAIQAKWKESDEANGGMFGPAEPHAFATVDLSDDGAVIEAAKQHGADLGYPVGFRDVDLKAGNYSSKYYPDLEVTDTRPLESVANDARRKIQKVLRQYAVQHIAGQPELARTFDPDSVGTGSARWAEYVADMGNERRAYAAIMDRMRGDFAGRFAKGYRQTTGQEWKVLNVPLENGEAHSLAMLPTGARQAMKAQRQSSRDKLRNRTRGKYASENASLLEKEAAAKADGTQLQAFGNEEAQTETQRLDTHRLTLGTAAEAMVKGMLPRVNLKKGTVAAGNINMSHGDNMKRQRAIKQLEAIGRMGLSLGTGCIHADTLIHDPAHDITRTVAEWMARDEAPRVYALDHSGRTVIAQASVPFVKGYEMMYEVSTSSGKKIKVTAAHRFLTPAGWKKLSEIGPGHSIRVSEHCGHVAIATSGGAFRQTDGAPSLPLGGAHGFLPSDECLPASTSGTGPLGCGASARRFAQTLRDWTGRCFAYSRPCDAPPRTMLTGAQETAPLPDGALERSRLDWRQGDLASKATRSQFCQLSGRLSTMGSWVLCKTRLAEPQVSPGAGDSNLCWRRNSQAHAQSLRRSNLADSILEVWNRAVQGLTSFHVPATMTAAGLASPTPGAVAGWSRGCIQSLPQCEYRSSRPHGGRGETPLECPFSCDPTSTLEYNSAWEQVEGVAVFEKSLVFDLEVYEHHNYLAHGIWNHNSGKSIIALGAHAHLRQAGKVKRSMFAVPSAVQEQFGSEAARFYDMTSPHAPKWFADGGASADERRAAYKDDSGHDLCVVTHQALRDDLAWALAQHKFSGDVKAATEWLADAPKAERNAAMKAATAAQGWNFDMSIVDEAQNLLNRQGKEDSAMAATIDAFNHDKPYYASMSADPVKNDPSEAFDFLSKIAPSRYVEDSEAGTPGAITKGEFMRKYAGRTNASVEALQREMAPYHYAESITPDTEKVTRTHTLPLTSPQQAEYNGVLANYQKARAARIRGEVDVAAVKALSPGSFTGPADGHEAIAKRLQDSLGILRDTALDRVVNCHPAGAKFVHLDKMLQENPPADKPAIIFAHSLDAVDMIQKHLKEQGHRVVSMTGTMPVTEKERVKQQFSPQWDDRSGQYVHEPEADIIVTSDAGSEGWNGQRGQQEYHWDQPATAKTYRQREGRAYRIGQRNTVEVHDLMTDTAHERRKRRLLERKDRMRDALTTPAEMIDDSGLAATIGRQVAAERQKYVKQQVRLAA